jgi:cell division protein FtsW
MKQSGTQRNHIDLPTLVAVLALMLMSLGIVYSASSSYAQLRFNQSEHMLEKHALMVLLGIIFLFVGTRIDYHKIQKFTKPAVVVALALLSITFVLGGEAKGATRWLRFGGLSFQPSEFAKYALLFHLCTMIALKGDHITDFRKGLLPMLFWMGGITGLVMLQPNFSMGSMIFVLSLILLFIARAKMSQMGLVIAVLIPVLLVFMLAKPYRRERIMNYLGMGKDTVKVEPNYQVKQGIIAFGNGGMFGVGPGESKQRDLFLPESYGDFVFSIVGEEYGFIGAIGCLALFLLVMVRGFKIAKFARDPFGKYLAIAITSAITVYALINAGVTLGILPTTGLPMPFVSYGGSSMVFSACAAGVLLNISSHTDLHPRARQVPVVGSVNAGEPSVGKVY